MTFGRFRIKFGGSIKRQMNPFRKEKNVRIKRERKIRKILRKKCMQKLSKEL